MSRENWELCGFLDAGAWKTAMSDTTEKGGHRMSTTQFQEGDLVEAVKNESVIRGRITGCDSNFLGTSRTTINQLTADGFTLTLIEHPEPKVELPTEVGYYESEWYSTGEGAYAYRFDGQRWFGGWGDEMEFEPGYMAELGKLTRLEPRSETARAVIEWIRANYWALIDVDEITILRNARQHFGVTGD